MVFTYRSMDIKKLETKEHLTAKKDIYRAGNWTIFVNCYLEFPTLLIIFNSHAIFYTFFLYFTIIIAYYLTITSPNGRYLTMWLKMMDNLNLVQGLTFIYTTETQPLVLIKKKTWPC